MTPSEQKRFIENLKIKVANATKKQKQKYGLV